MSVHLDYEGHVALVTLDDASTRNALTEESALELIRALKEAERRPETCAVVLCGANDTFCAGADRALLAAAGERPADPELIRALETIYRSFTVLATLRVPTIAAVRGAVVGAGANLFLSADVRIVADDARYIAGFLKIGLHPGGGHFLLSERAIGPQSAVALGIFGEEIRGPRLVELSLAWEALPAEAVEGRAIEIASRLNDPELVRAAVDTFRSQSSARHVPLQAAVRAEQAAQLWSLGRRA